MARSHTSTKRRRRCFLAVLTKGARLRRLIVVLVREVVCNAAQTIDRPRASNRLETALGVPISRLCTFPAVVPRGARRCRHLKTGFIADGSCRTDDRIGKTRLRTSCLVSSVRCCMQCYTQNASHLVADVANWTFDALVATGPVVIEARGTERRK